MLVSIPKRGLRAFRQFRGQRRRVHPGADESRQTSAGQSEAEARQPPPAAHRHCPRWRRHWLRRSQNRRVRCRRSPSIRLAVFRGRAALVRLCCPSPSPAHCSMRYECCPSRECIGLLTRRSIPAVSDPREVRSGFALHEPALPCAILRGLRTSRSYADEVIWLTARLNRRTEDL
jgi:hypothetical protein